MSLVLMTCNDELLRSMMSAIPSRSTSLMIGSNDPVWLSGMTSLDETMKQYEGVLQTTNSDLPSAWKSNAEVVPQ